MSLGNDAMSEVSKAILSVDGPYIDISDPEKLFEQTMLLHKYQDEPDESFPMVFFYIDGMSSRLAANDRFENSVNIDISIIYKIPPEESISDGVERGARCCRQVYRKIFERQTSGEAVASLFPVGEMQIDATADYGVDHAETDSLNGAATMKFTLGQIEVLQQEET
ncbi:hypothetical protein R83H12_00430 [Fibrobacteria bacterium R8-3-H12]